MRRTELLHGLSEEAVGDWVNFDSRTERAVDNPVASILGDRPNVASRQKKSTGDSTEKIRQKMQVVFAKSNGFVFHEVFFPQLATFQKRRQEHQG